MTTVLPTPAPPKRADFTTLCERTDEVDHLDAGFQNIRLGILVDERGRGTMNSIFLGKLDRASLVGGLANDVEDAAKHTFTNRNGDRRRSIEDVHSALESFGPTHSNCAHPVLAKMLLDFEGQFYGPLDRI